jgi:hypothetical protein
MIIWLHVFNPILQDLFILYIQVNNWEFLDCINMKNQIVFRTFSLKNQFVGGVSN